MTIDNPTADELAAHELRVERANGIIRGTMVTAGKDVRLALSMMCKGDLVAEQYADKHGGNWNEAIAAKAWELAGE